MTVSAKALADELDGLAYLLSEANTNSQAGLDDICKRAAAFIRALPAQPSREAVARIIEPWAWYQKYRGVITTGITEHIKHSLIKADTILALPLSDGLRATREEVARVATAIGMVSSEPLTDAECRDLAQAAISALSPPSSDGLREAVAFINERLTDLAEANALYGKDKLLSAPDKIARNNREISWLKDLRSLLALQSPTAQEGVQAATEPAEAPIGHLRAALENLRTAELKKLDEIDGDTLKDEYKRQWQSGKISGIAAAIGSVSAENRAEPIAYTNRAQLGFLKDPQCVDIPMAMWARKSSTSSIPLYATPPVPDRAAIVEEQARFLLARLEEYDPGDDEAERDFHGHVAPAISRLRSTLTPPKLTKGSE